MERRAGFTLIELLITITIMVVLLTLSVVSLRANQAYARDEERKSDVAVIAQQLETYYRAGSDEATALPTIRLASASPSRHTAQLAVWPPSGSNDYKPGEYPPTEFMNDETEIRETLRDIDPKVLRAPNIASTAPISLVNATSASEPSPSVDEYIYQPLDANGTLCQSSLTECRKFNIFYKLENDTTVQKVMSKNQ
jgi:prepilin-type N-terminal cleavage/methylation domain-containing protein